MLQSNQQVPGAPGDRLSTVKMDMESNRILYCRVGSCHTPSGGPYIYVHTVNSLVVVRLLSVSQHCAQLVRVLSDHPAALLVEGVGLCRTQPNPRERKLRKAVQGSPWPDVGDKSSNIPQRTRARGVPEK